MKTGENSPAGRSRATQISSSWQINAKNWTHVVREGKITSRNTGTDLALVGAIDKACPNTLIDVGCGEGWLVRRMRDNPSCRAVGVDGSEALIENACNVDPSGHYVALEYPDLSALPQALAGPFDVAVCNFSLLEEDLQPALVAIKQCLTTTGTLLIQTLHPFNNPSDQPYENGWRVETFAGMAGDNWEPMPWYFRTLESWTREIDSAGMCLTRLDEPLDPTTSRPLSILFSCQIAK
ncbi:MAG: trans-aconitate 2-methyltransferase [Burkholderiaceae bacterium]